MILTVDMRTRTPIYEQLEQSVRRQAVEGVLKPDEPLPSVRRLAAELAVNPNTIQKAYNELERQGIVYSVPGKGSFISADILQIAEEERKKYETKFRETVVSAKAAGVAEDALKQVIEEVYREEKLL